MDDLANTFERVGSPGEDPFDLEGDLLDGQIRVEKVVGEGELSVVYRGLHEGIRAPVAIKCLNLPETLDPKLVQPISEGFREGARLHYRLAQGHLHIAQTLALGTTVAPRTGAQIPYMVREWIEGSSLAEDLAVRARAKARPRTVAQAVELLESAADAMAHAHAEGVCHHALSPRNLFIAKSPNREVLKVLDFGMARHGASQTAETGLRLLSSHAAPEQLDRRMGTPSPATDVFSFALVLFESVTGRPYFGSGVSVTEELLRVVESREPLRRLGSGAVSLGNLESVLSRALSPKPSERQPNLRAFWDDVKRAVERPSPSAQSVPKPVRPPPLPVTRFEAPASAPAVAITVESGRAPDPDTIPAPPMFEGDARASIPMLGGSLRARFHALSAKATAYFVDSPVAVARIGAVGAGVFVVIIIATIGRSARTSANATATAPHEQRSPRAFVNETAMLVLGEASLRVAPKGSAFDRGGMRQRFDETAADLESCTRRGGPRGPGSIRVIVQPNGKVIRLQIGPPYAGTSTGHCIASRFVATELPAFVGPPRAMNYIFNTIPFDQPVEMRKARTP